MLLRDKPWDKNLQLMLIALFGFNLWPHIQLVPHWVTALALVSIIWKLLYLTRGFQLPKKWVVSVVSLLVGFGVFGTYSTIFGQEAAGALLVATTSLKLLETNRYRDAMLVVFTSYFLLMVYLLDVQTVAATAMLFVDVALITSLMAQIHQRERKSMISFRPTFKMLALTLPLWAFLFIFFPRFSTGLWSSPASRASTGFSEDLDPGSVGKLTDSDEIAFRVSFNGTVGLSPEALYWRGAVLTNGNGLKWTKASEKLHADAYAQDTNAKSVGQTIWLEPGFQKWLFTLDTPIAVASPSSGLLHLVRRQPGFIYEFSHPGFARTTYTVRSVMPSPIQILGPLERTIYLQLPPSLDSRVTELAQQLRQNAEAKSGPQLLTSVEERAARNALEWFSKNGFHYSKNPGMIQGADGSEQLSEFLFNRKIGFCEHFAAAFATLMRAAHVPTRVVVGFQGATQNTIGDYWVVRKMDAHAWAEIWSEGVDHRGHWIRVDPTEAVAPMRLQLGGDFNRLDEGAAATLGAEELRRILGGGFDGGSKKLQLAIDLMQMKWNAFLLAYDFNYQLQVLADLGVSQGGWFVLAAVIGICVLLFAGIVVWFNSRRARDQDPLLNEWRRFCGILAKVGIERAPSEGPLAFAKRAGGLLPGKAEEISQIAKHFAELRYGTRASSDVRKERRELRLMVRGFSIG